MSKMKIIDRRSEISIMNEKTLLSKLNNPFIVNMYFTFQDFSNLYLVMDLLTGGDLRYQLAKRKKFSERETKFFIANMLLALEYIHSKNIIHRDIKPENLVLEKNGYLRITDFGVAKINEKDNSSETSGTPGYMAPEVMLVQNHSFPSDFFALGVIGYEFMLGYRPYLGRSRKEIKDLIIYKQARINDSEIPYSWSLESGDFINKLLKRKPFQRMGYHGVKEIKNHPWMKDIKWEYLKEKKIIAPFIPNPNKENFDKVYCEKVENIGETTMERYQEYGESELFVNVFEGYTYINITYLNSKRKENNSKNTPLIKFESSKLQKNYTTNMTNKKKALSISQDNILNHSRSHKKLKININRKTQRINSGSKNKYTINFVKQRSSSKKNPISIKLNKNYISNMNSKRNYNEIILKEKEKKSMKKKCLNISLRMKDEKIDDKLNDNNNNSNKYSSSKRFTMNKSNSVKVLNSLNKNYNLIYNKSNNLNKPKNINNICSTKYSDFNKNKKLQIKIDIKNQTKKVYPSIFTPVTRFNNLPKEKSVTNNIIENNILLNNRDMIKVNNILKKKAKYTEIENKEKKKDDKNNGKYGDLDLYIHKTGKENNKRPQSKIMMWIQKSLPNKLSENTKKSTKADNNCQSHINNDNKSITNLELYTNNISNNFSLNQKLNNKTFNSIESMHKKK